MVTTGTHTTPIQRYIDDMTFTFTQEADYCSVDVRKLLQSTSVTVTPVTVTIGYKDPFLSQKKDLILLKIN